MLRELLQKVSSDTKLPQATNFVKSLQKISDLLFYSDYAAFVGRQQTEMKTT